MPVRSGREDPDWLTLQRAAPCQLARAATSFRLLTELSFRYVLCITLFGGGFLLQVSGILALATADCVVNYPAVANAYMKLN